MGYKTEKTEGQKLKLKSFYFIKKDTNVIKIR